MSFLDSFLNKGTTQLLLMHQDHLMTAFHFKVHLNAVVGVGVVVGGVVVGGGDGGVVVVIDIVGGGGL